MVVWINGPYGVGKSTLVEQLVRDGPKGFVFDAEAVGNAARDTLPKEMYNGALFECYTRWFEMCVVLLQDISAHYDGILYVPMTLALPDSFEKFARPLRESGIPVKHILLESNHATVLERILERGEKADCWCAQHIDFCLEQQGKFENVIRIPSVGEPVTALAEAVRKVLGV